MKRSWPKRAFRIATLFVPSALAWYVAFAAQHPGDLTVAVTFALGPMWMLLTGALVLRTSGAMLRRARDPATPILAHIDVLTAGGSALAWFSAFAIMGAVWLGYASLAAVGMLGTGVFHVVVLLTFIAIRGNDPMRRSSISRRFVPETVSEGDDLVEELHFEGTRIPIGFRLFATGRIGPRWPTCRHTLEATESGGEVVLASEVGPAIRGDHEAEPIQIWLQDIFGLCRSMRMQTGAARLTVLPRLRATEKTAPLLDRGQGPRAPRATTRLPTEGHFRLREYQQGDDVRRIHWVRSLAAREVIVRLPDELPPDRPRVRIVLDTFFPDALTLDATAPAELLDLLVTTWIALGRALAESGAQVTLVTAVPQAGQAGSAAMVRHELSPRVPGGALRLGAQVAWQNQMLLEQMLTDEATFIVSRGVLASPPPDPHGRLRWVVATLPNPTEPKWTLRSDARMPYPMGSAENRWTHRRREGTRLARGRAEHNRAMLAMRTYITKFPPKSFFAAITPEGSIRLEAMR